MSPVADTLDSMNPLDDGYVRDGINDAVRHARAARDFFDATVTISNVAAAAAATFEPPVPVVPPVSGSLWAPAVAGSDEICQQVGSAAAALRERSARAAVDAAREAVDYAHKMGIQAVPAEIARRALEEE